MATIDQQIGQGGRGISQESGADPLLDVLNDVADDLGTLKGAAIAAPALLAFTDPPSAAEMALLRTLVNEIRTRLNADAAVTLKTVKGT